MPAWHVVANGIRQDTDLAPGGAGLTDVYVIPYVIDDGPAQGQQFEVRVAKSVYGPATVAKAIETDAANHHEIGGMSGGTS
jgi:hypothetical protein